MHPLTRHPRRRRHVGLLTAHLAITALLLGACGAGDGGEAPDNAPPRAAEEAAQDGTENRAATAPSGEPRGTVEIDDHAHQVALTDDPASRCLLSEDFVGVMDMVSSDGVRVDVGYIKVASTWTATLFVDGAPAWTTGNTDQPPGVHTDFDLSDGRLVISGTWNDVNGAGTTKQIRVELTCPTS